MTKFKYGWSALPKLEMDDDKDLQVEPQLATAVISQAFQDAGILERMLKRKKVSFGGNGYFKALKPSFGSNYAQRCLRDASLDAVTAAEFLCWPNETLDLWAGCLGISSDKIIEESRKQLAWLYKPLAEKRSAHVQRLLQAA